MISKELLSEVLNQNVTSVYKQHEQYRYTTSNTNGAWVSGSDVPFPNIYELAHMCKEWAYTNHEAVINIFQKTRYNPYTAKLEGKVFQSDTEPEAIFKACEYILKEHSCNQLT